MTKLAAPALVLLLTSSFFSSPLGAQTAETKPPAKPDYSQEAYVIEQIQSTVTFSNDGNSIRDQITRIRVQTDSGVKLWGLLRFPYQSATQTVELDYVRVHKPDGTVVTTPEDNAQDLDAEITRSAPMFSDLREKQVAVKGLSVGDTLECEVHWRTTKPLAPGQFWFDYNFTHDAVVLDERLQINVPSGRAVKIKGPLATQSVTDSAAFRTYSWKESHLESAAAKKEKSSNVDAARGRLPQPDVLLSTFQSWDEVGRWYWGLQKDRAEPTPEIRAKAAELTKDVSNDAARLHAIYNYVSLRYRYIGIDFGIGRYQPHSAEDILGNNFGDCKDKHTLLASLLQAVGITVYPALISSSRKLDPDVPTPAQFDHVIAYVPKGADNLWLDTTPEIAPFGYLLPQLRDKQALVMTGDNSAHLVTTPAEPAIHGLRVFSIDGKLNDDGSLDAKINSSDRDDLELAMREAFRSVPTPQWKDLVQQISYGLGFSGTVSDVDASSPESTDEFFKFSYSYHRKDYPDWSNHRLLMPGLPFLLPSHEDEDASGDEPIFLGPQLETDSDAKVALPGGYTPVVPSSVDLVRDYAEYHASYSVAGGVLTSRRSFRIKLQEVPTAEKDEYEKFVKSVRDDVDRYVQCASSPGVGVNGPAKAAEYFRDAVDALPDSTVVEANRMESDSQASLTQRDLNAAIFALKGAVVVDPKFARGWLRLAAIQSAMRQTDDAINSEHKAIESDPTQPICYKALAFSLMSLNRFDEAIPVWQDLLKIAPDDRDAPSNLGTLFMRQKRYPEALTQLQTAVKLSPHNAGSLALLAGAYILSGDLENGRATVQHVRELGNTAEALNDISYEIADANQDLPAALDYAQEAVRREEESSRSVQLDSLTVPDLRHTLSLASFWDTLGWVHFRLGHLDQAEDYLRAAWLLCQYGVVGDHLGQVYEKEQKKQEAIHMYRLTLATTERPLSQGRKQEIRDHLEVLAPGTNATGQDLLRIRPGETFPDEELTKLRTVKLPRIVPGTATAEFFLEIAPGPKVEDAKFVSGSEELKPAEDILNLNHVTFEMAFPKGSSARVVRRGLLACTPLSGCELVMLPLDSVRSVN